MAARTRSRHRNRGKALHPTIAAAASRPSTPQTSTMLDILNSLTRPMTGFNAVPMARDPRNLVPFGPLNPLNPAPLDPSRPDTGRPAPRITEYPVAWNVPGNSNRLVSWRTLRDAADNVDILRRCIEVRKKHVRGLEWAWTVSDQAVADAYRADPSRGKDDVEARLRDQWLPEINRLTEFWQWPWKSNGLDFGAWVNGVMEEYIVLDALAIYPQTTYGGDLLALEVIDGTTIKPLLDSRGARPQTPFPAYQQDLYGFPRGEWQATVQVDADGNEVINSGFLADQLYYHRENYRAFTPYGFSAVEQALISARLYLKRQGWMLSEYDDGVLPVMLLESPETLSITPRERDEYEVALNDDLTGQTRARHRAKMLWPGTTPTVLPSADERYKPDYDLYLIKLLASHFGVTIAELGFTEAKGLGSTGFHEGQADVQARVGLTPDSAMLASFIGTLSARFLKAPSELVFKFMDPEHDDEAVADAVATARVNRGTMTTNDDRQRIGLPLLDIPEADMPYIASATGPVFLEGSSAPKVDPALQGAAGATNAAVDQNQPAPQAKPKPDAKPKPAPPKNKAAGPDHNIAEAVAAQLSDDYPPDAVTWVKGAHWRGPVMVPLDQLDMAGRDTWRASKEPKRVAQFAKRTRRGKVSPAVLVQTPGSDKMVIIDGHHRALAAEQLDRPILAYVGKVGAKTGPWDEMHASQRPARGALDNAPTSGAPSGAAKAALTPAVVAVDGDKVAEVLAYRRFVKRARHDRPFAWNHHSPAEVAELTKAGDPDPKEGAAETPPPVQPDTRWPAWAVDEAVSQYWADKIQQAMTRGLDIRAMAEAWSRDTAHWRPGDPTPDPVTWLMSMGVGVGRLADFLGPVLRDALTVGYSVGAQSSAAAMAGDARTGVTVDWSKFKPGNVDAARRVLSADGMDVGLAQMLDDYGVTINAIAANRLDELAAVLADGLERGGAPQTIATAIRGAVADPGRAMTIAWTETNRAQSAASLDQYTARGVAAKEWFTARDQRVCPVCQANADQGAIPLADSFVSGEPTPPGHPRCRCALLPATLTAAAVPAAEPTLADHIASGVDSSTVLGGGMSARTELVTFADGAKAVRKTVLNDDVRDPADTQDAEELASRFAAALGINAPEVHRVAADEIYMAYVAGGLTGMEHYAYDIANDAAAQELADSTAGRRLGLFDLAIGNVDRNGGNWLIDGTELTAIDHGFAFQTWAGHEAELLDIVTGPNNLFANRLHDSGDFSRADVEQLLQVLATLRPEFDRLGHDDWYTDAVTRLGVVAQGARGDGSLF